jgi:hypothetical protein
MKTITTLKLNSVSTIIFALATFGLILTAGVRAASDPKFTTIDFPGAISTVAQDINSEGDIVGVYTEVGNMMHGFFLHDGTFTSIDFPGSTMTHVYGINPRGDIVGEYRDLANKWHGFMLHDAVFTPIDFPGATTTSAWGISPKRTIAGTYSDASGKMHAYLLNKRGEFTSLDPPWGFDQGQVHGVNSIGVAVGCWWVGGVMHSLLVKDGEYITNDFPDSMMSMNWRINSSGWMVGHYNDVSNKTHGYLAMGSLKYT